MFKRVSLAEWIVHFNANRNWERMAENTSTRQEIMSQGISLCYIREHGTAGFAITRKHELVGLWNLDCEDVNAEELMRKVKTVARNYNLKLHLNCYDGYLVEFYKRSEFVEYNRSKNFKKYAPDIVYMRLE